MTNDYYYFDVDVPHKKSSLLLYLALWTDKTDKNKKELNQNISE